MTSSFKKFASKDFISKTSLATEKRTLALEKSSTDPLKTTTSSKLSKTSKFLV